MYRFPAPRFYCNLKPAVTVREPPTRQIAVACVRQFRFGTLPLKLLPLTLTA